MTNKIIINCQFHDEKTPSFEINIDDSKYYCYSCGASGDVLNIQFDLSKPEFINETNDKLYNIGLNFIDHFKKELVSLKIPTSEADKIISIVNELEKRKL